MNSDYDSYEDVLYISIPDCPVAADNAHTSHGIIVRMLKNHVVGLTIIDASEFLRVSKEELKASFNGKPIKSEDRK